MTDSPSQIEEAIRQAVRTEIAAIRTSVPGVVVDYDHDDQRATVQPAVRSAYTDPETGDRRTYLPEPVANCPVRFLSGGGFSLSFPLEPGDHVKIICAERSIDEWSSTGADENEPKDARRFDLSDAIVEPGLRAFADALASGRIDEDALVIGCESGDEIHLGGAGLADSRLVAIADAVRQELDDIWSALNNHTHPGVVSGNSATGPSSSIGSAGDVSADKVKAE